MLFLPSVALCCFSTAAVAMAAELLQDQLSLTSREDDKVSFSCKNTDQCNIESDKSSYIWWYQKKETETFTVILDIDRGESKNCAVDSRYNHPQIADFSAVRTENGCELQINKVKLLHSATYYCSCYKEGYFTVGDNLYKIFGSGTRLYVTAEPVVKPKVSVYPASRADLKGKSSLLCLATSMFPPLVRFSWRRGGEPVDLGETVELGEPGRPASIMLIDREKAAADRYVCSVEHQGGAVEARIPAEPPVAPTAAAAASGPPERDTAHQTDYGDTRKQPGSAQRGREEDREQEPVSFQSQCRVKLLSLVYTVMIVKSMVYCCGLSLLMIHTNKGGSTNTHAD
ncbi:immunoglobulin lambda-1 light chain-like [Centroberyx affinis]|uniref:immunoglobulin lambda-1 light chain-like n=1 Tax=Centroberyx affinis TaxID=166261 RepID=UPI003A5C340B